LNAEYYETVWALIVKHFDNPRLENYLHCLFEAKPLSETSVKSINASIDSIEQRSSDRLENFKDCIYLYALKRRFDKETKRHWERSLSEILAYGDSQMDLRT